jgi:DNA repair exonuclease SbcCD ATPase subunit
MATMDVVIRNMINALAGKYSFDSDEAFEYIQMETDTNYLVEIFKMASVEMPKQTVKIIEENKGGAENNSDMDEKIATCKKNIATWEKKLADGKAKDTDKQREKIDKEKAKLAKLEKKVEQTEKKVEQTEKKVDTKKTDVKEVEKKVETKKTETKEKRIKRFSPVMASQLKKLVEDGGLEMNDTMKKDFQQYVEDLSDDKYRESGLADHMRDFVKTKKKVTKKVDETEAEKKTEPMDTTIGSSNAVGGGGPEVQVLTLEELQAIATIASVDPPGTFWDADSGRFVRGPAKDDGEDYIELTFEKKKYVVGEKTGRVYEARDTDDVFAGFCGVGKFKGMKMP